MKPNKGNKKKNLLGLFSLILWAILLTMLFRSCSSTSMKANQRMVDYSTFRQWVTAELVERVDMGGNEYVITIKDGMEQKAAGYLPKEEPSSGGIFQIGDPVPLEDMEYVTTPPPVSDLSLITLMDTDRKSVV